MNDSYFNTPVYEGKYEPIFRFAEFGDVSNYWIALTYYINRDRYQTARHSRGYSLDLTLTNIDGEYIFGEIPQSHRNALQARGYKLGGQTAEPVNDAGDLLRVRETYVYAPSQTYIVRNSDVVPVWGLNDTDYATKSYLLNYGNVYRTDFYHHSIVNVANPHLFKTGDTVMLAGYGRYKVQYIGYSMWPTAKVSAGHSKIVRISGSQIELSDSLDFELDSEYFYLRENYDDWANAYVRHQASYWNCLNGATLPDAWGGTLSPTQTYLMKAYATRVYAKRRMPTRERVSFSLTEPSLANIGIFIPQLQTGETRDTISRETEPTCASWKNKVANGTWFRYEEPEVKYDAENGVYELRIRETKCI